MNIRGWIKDFVYNESKRRLKFRISYLVAPMYFLTDITSNVALALEYVPGIRFVEDAALEVYNRIFGTLNDTNTLAPLLILSMFGMMTYALWERKRRSAVRMDRKTAGEALVRASGATLIDWIFASLLFFSASLDLLNVLATSPEWVSVTVTTFSYTLAAASLMQEYIKKKMGVAIRDPTERIFDPIEAARRLCNFIKCTKNEPYVVPCLVRMSV